MFNAMLDDVLMDIALQAHQDIARSKTACDVCGTRCALARPPLCALTASQVPRACVVFTHARSSTETPVAHLPGQSAWTGAQPSAGSGSGSGGTTMSFSLGGSQSGTDGKTATTAYLPCVKCDREVRRRLGVVHGPS
jgi:hypothetical protein